MSFTGQTIFVAGHNGMVGRAVCREFQKHCDLSQILTANRDELDLSSKKSVSAFFEKNKIDMVVNCAAKVGGIHANNVEPASFIYENLMIACHVTHACYENGVSRLLNLGSSCIYPKNAAQPMKEEGLLTGPLELTNEPYAIAKIAAIKLCESYNRQHGCDFRSVMPTNLYGEFDNFHSENSHVIPGLMDRFHRAKVESLDEVVVWGSGKVFREFLYVSDLAEACIHFLKMEKETFWAQTAERCSHINIGSGEEVSVRDLAQTIKEVIGFKGTLTFDTSKPDGTPRKLLDVSKAKSMGWSASTGFRDGLQKVYGWYLDNIDEIRKN